MDMKKIRLRHLVNNEFDFYPKDKFDESENINRYDSDEEKNESDLEEENELFFIDEASAKTLKNQIGDEMSFMIEKFIEDEEICLTQKKNINPKYSNAYCRTTTEKKLKDGLDRFEDDYVDNDVLNSINFLSNNLESSDFASYDNFLKEFELKCNFENLETSLFYINVYQYFSLRISYFKENLDNNYENSNNFINIETLTLIKNLLRISHNLHSNFLQLFDNSSNNYSNKTIEEILKYERIFGYLLNLNENLLDLLIKNVSLNISSDFDFIINITKLIKVIANKEIIHQLQSQDDSERESSFSTVIKSKLKSIILIIYSLFKDSLYHFNIEEKKSLFNVCFLIIKYKNLSNIFIPIIDIISIIIERNSKEFIDKFVEYMITFYREFTLANTIKDEKFWILNIKVSHRFKYFFGVYKCYNGDTISIFTLLFLRIFSVIYILDGENDNNSNLFLNSFESFLSKILETNQNALLLSLYCILEDLLNIKNNIEFSINLVILTNLFLFFSNLMTQTDMELSKRKFFMNCFELVLENLLKEFKMIKNSYLCLSSAKKNESEKTLECKCFACIYSFQICKSKGMYFQCNQCKWKTNLKLQIIKPDEDNNPDICGFCDLKSYFQLLGGELCEETKFFNLIETNEEIIEEFSKKKSLNENETAKTDDVQLNNINRNLFSKFLFHQDLLYRNSSTFIQANILNFIINFNKNENSTFSMNLNSSYYIFMRVLISDQKLSLPQYKNFYSNMNNFYEKYKNRIFNSIPDIYIDESCLNYFYFYYFHVNFLFSGHYRIIDMLINEKYSKMPWFIRYKALKILEKILIFEGELKIFENFKPEMLSILLGDSSYYIKEYSLEILFKLYKYKKIERKSFLNILFENVNESSFLIRKRIMKALVGITLEDLSNIENYLDNLKTINFIFLNKIVDNSESIKIKNVIYQFFLQIFSSPKKNQQFLSDLIDTFIILLNDHEDNSFNHNNSFFEHIKMLFTILIDEKNLKFKELNFLLDYIFSKYIDIGEVNIKSKNYTMNFIQALNLVKIICNYSVENVVIYLDILLNLLKLEENDSEINNNQLNKIKQLICDIFGNILDKNHCNIKNKFISSLENHLIKIILSKPNNVMISALDCYFKILSKNILSYDKLRELTLKNYQFLKSQTRDLIQGYINIRSEALSFPMAITSKSLTLLSYITFCSDDEQLELIFDFMNVNDCSSLNKNICLNIFLIYKDYINITKLKDMSSVRYIAFEALGYFWIRFPETLNDSKDIIELILKNLSNDDEKLIVLRTFNNFFNKICMKLKLYNNIKDDFGVIHLFFENFINDITRFLVNESNFYIRLQAINLIKLIVELGNINVHNILPYIFSALFDYVNEIRYIAAALLEKIVKISKDKFLGFMKENLKISFNFQKRIFILPGLLNSFVKVLSNRDLNDGNKKFEIQNENVFELFLYKISKSKDDFRKKILIKFIETFQEIKNLHGESFNKMCLSDCLNKIEFYEYVASLIGDFKFSDRNEIFSIYQSLYKDYTTEALVFYTKLKEYAESTQILIDNKLIMLFQSVCLKMSLFKFLLAKYENFDYYEEIIKINFDEFIEANCAINNINVTIKKNKSDDPCFSKELYNFKFHQFYNSFLVYLKNIYKLCLKKYFNSNDKQKLVSLLKISKLVYKMKIKEIRSSVAKVKKKSNKFDDNKLNKMLSSLLFGDSQISTFDKINSKNKIEVDKIEVNKIEVNKNKDRKITILKENKRRVTLENEESHLINGNHNKDKRGATKKHLKKKKANF